jgi:SOS-response transcriptional repressor LexA
MGVIRLSPDKNRYRLNISFIFCNAHKHPYKIEKMTNLADRLKAARAHAGLSQGELAKAAGVKQPVISQLETGKNVGSTFVVSIAKACGVSPEWLVNGKGSMVPDGSDFDANVEPALAPVKFYEYPEISWVQAGKAMEALVIGNITNFEKHPSDAWAGTNGFWLKVKGPSMTSTGGVTFAEGMLILIAPGFDVESGQYVVAKMVDTEEATFKQLYRDSGKTYLRPLNPAFSTIEIDDRWQIVGRVVDAKWPRSVL